MCNASDAWEIYARLQQGMQRSSQINARAAGFETGLNQILSIIESGAIPHLAELEVQVRRTVSSAERLWRSRGRQLSIYGQAPEPGVSTDANLMLDGVRKKVGVASLRLLADAAAGFTDGELAQRHGSTPGAIRTKLSRVRAKLAT